MTFDLTRLLAEIATAADNEEVAALLARDADALAALPEDEREMANEQIADAIRERREAHSAPELPAVTQAADGTFWVRNVEMGPFLTHAAAWNWVDKNSFSGRADSDRYHRIRAAFAGRGAPSNSRK